QAGGGKRERKNFTATMASEMRSRKEKNGIAIVQQGAGERRQGWRQGGLETTMQPLSYENILWSLCNFISRARSGDIGGTEAAGGDEEGACLVEDKIQSNESDRHPHVRHGAVRNEEVRQHVHCRFLKEGMAAVAT